MGPDPSGGGAAGGSVTAPTLSASEGDVIPFEQRGHDLGRRYEFGDEIARGGNGKVLRAYDRVLRRDVAIKLPLDPLGSPRLRAEATLLSRLQHPSVIPVYDVGTGPDGTTFYAMKLVTGSSLRDALRGAETLEGRLAMVPHVIAIAEAVAYAHAGGVIHRDLKPGNVLIGDFGETLVIDWGLAVSTDGGPQAPAGVVGTPAYMPPEQARGEPVDERADVYAIGAILYHLLAGEAPYARAEGSLPGVVAGGPPPALEELQPRAPRDLVAIAGKAMARAREARYLTARELAEDLVRFQTGRLVSARRYSFLMRARHWARARRGPLLAGAAALGGAAIVAARSLALADPCAATTAVIDGAWSAEIARSLRPAFVDSGRPYGGQMHDRVAATLDTYAASWKTMRRDVCEATAVRREQSAELLDLRMRCLDRRLGTLRGLVARFAAATPTVVDRALEAARGLEPLSGCADVEALGSTTPLPAEPAARARALALQARTLDAASYFHTGQYAKGRDLIAPIVDEARAAGYAPALADALRWRALLEGGLQNTVASKGTLEEAVRVAASAHDDALFANLTVRLLYATAAQQGLIPEALALRPVTEAAIQRVGGNPLLERELNRGLALAYWRSMRFAEALPLARAALAANDAGPGDDAPEAVPLYEALGEIESGLGHHDEAAAAFARAQGIAARTVGAEHPYALAVLNARGTLAFRRRDLDEALRLYREAYDAFTRVHGPRTIAVANAAANVGMVYGTRGDHRESLAWGERALSIREEVLGADNSNTAAAHMHVGIDHLELGNDDQARHHLELARATFEKLHGPDDMRLAAPFALLAALERRAGRCAAARPLFLRSLSLYERWQPPPPFERGTTGAALAACLLDLRETAGALARAEAAVKDLEPTPETDELGDARFVLARALHATGREPARVRHLVDAAEEAWKAAGGKKSGQGRAWLAKAR